MANRTFRTIAELVPQTVSSVFLSFYGTRRGANESATRIQPRGGRVAMLQLSQLENSGRFGPVAAAEENGVELPLTVSSKYYIATPRPVTLISALTAPRFGFS